MDARGPLWPKYLGAGSGAQTINDKIGVSEMEVKRIMVLGSGLMGRGIAQVAAQGGYITDMYDVNADQLKAAMDVIKKNMSVAVTKGKMTEEAMEATLARLNPTQDINLAAQAQVVIETVPEVAAIKTETYKKINEVCSEDIIIASNTSAMSITELASSTKRPDKFIGMHFFNPVHIMALVEIVEGQETDPEVTKVIEEISKNMGKETVVVKDFPGFITSRIQAAIGLESFRMLEQGVASPADIDKAVKLALRHPMGPFEMVDLVGLDTRLRICDYLAANLGEIYRPSATHRKYVAAGRYGKKVGKGIYDYNK